MVCLHYQAIYRFVKSHTWLEKRWTSWQKVIYREGGQQQKNYYSTRENNRKVITGLARWVILLASLCYKGKIFYYKIKLWKKI